MASTTAMFTGLSGLNVHSRNLDVIGNNIANVNTTAFKSSRLMFQTAFTRTMRPGTAPGDTTGGTNPTQIGQGVSIAGAQRDFRTGSINPTGDARDLAIEGSGFFVVGRGTDQFYTRAGSFRQNAEGDLVTITGERVRGYAVDENFRIIPGQLVDLNIPIGSLTIAEATRNVRFSGNLDADGIPASRGSSVRLGGTETSGLSLVSGASNPATPPNVLEADSLLVEVEDPAAPGSGTPLFEAGQTLRLSGAQKGTRTLPDADFTIGAATTVRELMDFLAAAMGVQTHAGPNPDGGTPGVSLNPANGRLVITGNTGSVNDLVIESTDLQLLDADGSFVRNPLASEKQAAADGESVRTTFVVFDSLGSPVTAELAMVLEEQTDGGTVWRYYVESRDDTDGGLQVATGRLEFDTSGRLVGGDGPTVRIDRSGTGAGTPLEFVLSFSGDMDNVTSLSSEGSAIAATYQDGAPIGTLSSFAVGADGTISGAFTNGVVRTLGQVAIATFTNQEGLVEEGGNLFRPGPNSGEPVVTTPGMMGAGQIVGGALELSNVDLGQEFINMILTSTGYSASSRVIRTTDELLQQLLVIGR